MKCLLNDYNLKGNVSQTSLSLVSNQENYRGFKIWTCKFITLDCGDFILRYNNATLETIISDIKLQFSTNFYIFKKIHKINEKIGRGQEYEFNDGFQTETDWHLFNVKSEADHIIITHPKAVSIIKVALINDTHDRFQMENKEDQLKSPIKIS